MMCAKGNYFLGFLTALFVAFPFRLEVDIDGSLRVAIASAVAKSGSGSDGDGDDGDGDDGGGDDGGGDDDEKGDDGDDRSHNPKSDAQKAEAKRISRAERLQNGARVTFADGSTSEIIGNRFRRTDTSGRVVERRKATGSDVSRLRAYFEGVEPGSQAKQPDVKSRAVRAFYRGRNIEIHYSNGWTEHVTRGKYVLRDQFGRIVASRRATRDDIKRLNRFRE